MTAQTRDDGCTNVTNCEWLCAFPSCPTHVHGNEVWCRTHVRSLDRKYLARNRGTVVLPPRRRAA